MYIVASNHAEDLADGRMVEPMATVELDEKTIGKDKKPAGSSIHHPHNKRLIDEGKLVETESPQAKAAQRKTEKEAAEGKNDNKEGSK